MLTTVSNYRRGGERLDRRYLVRAAAENPPGEKREMTKRTLVRLEVDYWRRGGDFPHLDHFEELDAGKPLLGWPERGDEDKCS